MYPSIIELNEREVWVLKELEAVSGSLEDCPNIAKFLNQELLVIQELKELYKVGGFL